MITYNDAPQLVGLLWTNDQSVAETPTWQHTNIQALGEIQTHDRSRRVAEEWHKVIKLNYKNSHSCHSCPRQPYLSADVTQLTACRTVFLNRGSCPVFDVLYPGICLDHGIHSALVLNTEMGHPGLCSSKTLLSPAQQLLACWTHLRTFFTSIHPSP